MKAGCLAKLSPQIGERDASSTRIHAAVATDDSGVRLPWLVFLINFVNIRLASFFSFSRLPKQIQVQVSSLMSLGIHG